jgi:hypothetical protein
VRDREEEGGRMNREVEVGGVVGQTGLSKLTEISSTPSTRTEK